MTNQLMVESKDLVPVRFSTGYYGMYLKQKWWEKLLSVR